MRMTKNEYKAYMKKCANRYWTEPGYNKDEMDADLDAVEIIPLDLGKYRLSSHIREWINKLFDEEDTDKNGNYMLRGFTQIERTEMSVLGLHYGDYSQCLNFWAYNDKERLVYTFCEGDTTLKMFETQEGYEKEKADCVAWYKEACA